MGKYRYNRYKDVEIDITRLQFNSDEDFVRVISAETQKWQERLRSRRDWYTALMWLKIPVSCARLVGLLVTLSHPFVVHHANQEHIMVYRKALQGSSFECVPSYGTHYVKVDCIVYEEETGRLLMVYEKPYYPSDPIAVKLVTGSVNSGEFFADAAVREVWEEAHVRCTFVGFIGCLNRIRTRFDRDEIAFGCVLIAEKEQKPTADGMEVMLACWMTPQDADSLCTASTKTWLNLAYSSPPMMRRYVSKDPYRPQKIDMYNGAPPLPSVISPEDPKK